MEFRQDPEWVRTVANKELVYSAPSQGSVACRRNIAYAAGDASDRLMDVYTPTEGTGSSFRPAILFVHGGPIPANLATSPKNWRIFESYGRLAAAMGFAGITFSHRLFSVASYPEAAEDLRAAVEYARAHAESLHVDQNSLCIWVFSGGGPLLSIYLRDAPEYVRCLVGYYPALDLPTSLFGVSIPRESFSPTVQLKKVTGCIPPIFIAKAALDSPELNATIDAFLRAAIENGVSVELANHPTGHHGFDVEDNNEQSRETIRRTFDFVTRYLTQQNRAI